jgi:hypothetical protein
VSGNLGRCVIGKEWSCQRVYFRDVTMGAMRYLCWLLLGLDEDDGGKFFFIGYVMNFIISDQLFEFNVGMQ